MAAHEVFSILREAEDTAKKSMVQLTGYNAPGEELAAILVMLRSLAFLHQTAHWTTSGPNFYSDHLMFERLYNALVGEVDSIGERATGMAAALAANAPRHARAVAAVCDAFAMPSDLITQALDAERAFLAGLEALRTAMKKNVLPLGTDNLLADIADKHESHVYLLQQRLAGSK